MPIFKEVLLENIRIIIWKYSETESYDLYLDEDKKQKRHIEKQMIKKILNISLPNHTIFYHQNGEPYLEPLTQNISISHSFPYAVLGISDKKIGIDIEFIQEKLQKISSKFLHNSEKQWLGTKENLLEYLTIIWTIKESLFKIHSEKQWSFKEFYQIDEFEINSLTDIKCRVFGKDGVDNYLAEVIKIEGYYLAIVK